MSYPCYIHLLCSTLPKGLTDSYEQSPAFQFFTKTELFSRFKPELNEQLLPLPVSRDSRMPVSTYIRSGSQGMVRCSSAIAASAILYGQSAAQYDNCTGNVASIGNGECDDSLNNNPSCAYDGGDCCPCTCDDGPSLQFPCGRAGYPCLDPNSGCLSPYAGICTGDIGGIGDGYCDSNNNNPSFL